MKVWQIQSFGIDQLVLADLPKPRPGRGQVLVKVHAVSLNYRDLLMVRGHYNPKMALPRIPCSDGAGEVVEVGEGVDTVTVGQRVAGIFMQHWLDGPPTAESSRGALGGDVDGMLAEYVVLHQSGVVEYPRTSLVCRSRHASLRWSYRMERSGQCGAGEAGRRRGDPGDGWGFHLCPAIREDGGSRRDRHFEQRRKVANEQRPWDSMPVSTIDSLPNGRNGYCKETEQPRRRFDCRSGRSRHLRQSLQAVRYGGTVAQIGVLSQSDQPLPIPLILHRQVRIQGIYVGSRSHFEAMNRAIMATRTQPVVDQIYTFDRGPRGPENHGNRFTFRQNSNPSCCVIPLFPTWLCRYLIEIAGLSKGQ